MVGPGDMPPDPMTAMAEGAVAAHEVHISYVAAGFSEEQAFELTKIVVTEALRGLFPR